MTDKPIFINSIESNTESKKSNKFIESTKRAVRKALVSTWIFTSSMGPVTTPTIIPASINSITSIAPLASTTIKTISIWTAASLLTACGGGEDEIDGPINPEKPTEKDTTPPTINISKSEIDITWWKQILIDWNQLYIWNELIASRTDNKTKNCNVTLSLNWKAITSWTTISEEWTLTIKVNDEAWNSKSMDIKLNITTEQEVISWLENLKNLNMQVDQEVNLLNWVTLINWAELVKTEIEIDGEKSEISDPNHYIPAYPWICNIILTVKDKNGKVTEYKVDNLTIKALEYKDMEINNIKPVDILPIIWQVESGDKKAYEHIEHLRIAEATKIRDMMREYGAGNHTAKEYQTLMNRLHTGMTMENPKWYNNYETIWWEIADEPSNHAHDERDILNTLINHANFNVVNPNNRRRTKLYEFVKSNPDKICIFWNSASAEVDKSTYLNWGNDDIKNLCKSKNFLLFDAWWNIKTKNWKPINKIYHEDIDWDESGRYSLPSSANWKNDSHPDRHLIVTIWTNANWDIDQTNEKYSSSKFPVWFHNDVLFAWRTFPHKSQEWEVEAWTGKYATSYVTYTNVAIADLCFQMFAEVKDADELLNMIKSSTDLRDHIRFNWEDQPLILMNPAWFFQKYLMPTDLPSNIQSWNTISLNKWYYKWVIFDIPWAEVKINWQRVAYSEANKSLIKSQNPMNLQWRINWDLCRKLWYKWKNIEWKIIVVDDKWNGLNIKKDISINFSN